MNLNQLRYFIEVANSTSISNASKTLFTTPQNISKAILQLEEELNIKLFHRVKSGMFLTSEGLTAYRMAKNIIEESESLLRAFSADNKSNRTDAIQADMSLLYPEWFNRLSVIILNKMTYNGIQFSNIHATTYDILTLNQMLLKDPLAFALRYDLAVCTLDVLEKERFKSTLVKYFDCYRLWTDTLHLEVSNSDPLLNYDKIPMSVLKELPLVVYSSDAYQSTFLEQLFHMRNLSIQIKYRIPGADGRAWGMMQNAYSLIGHPSSDFYPNIGFQLIPLEEDIQSEHWLLIPKGKKDFPHVQTFVKIVDDIFDLTKAV
jgi:DNA-binding transcriptional LysR family regulator